VTNGHHVPRVEAGRAHQNITFRKTEEIYFRAQPLKRRNTMKPFAKFVARRTILPASPEQALKQSARRPRWKPMSDAYDYFKANAIAATQKARALPFGRDKQKQRVVARVYHLLAREAAFAPNVHHLDEFRVARRLERQVERR
jgi:hypothetical protein